MGEGCDGLAHYLDEADMKVTWSKGWDRLLAKILELNVPIWQSKNFWVFYPHILITILNMYLLNQFTHKVHIESIFCYSCKLKRKLKKTEGELYGF